MKTRADPPPVQMPILLSPATTIYHWLSDVQGDIDESTGYLVAHPKGIFGKKVKELVRYTKSLSVEVKAIHHSRRTRLHPCLQSLGSILHFLSEFVCPVVFAAAAAYAYYQWTPTEVDSPPILPSINTTTTNASDTGPFDWLPSARQAGQFVGSSLRSIITAPVDFLTNAVDRGLHVEETVAIVQSTGTKLILLPLLFGAVYFLVKLTSRLLVHAQTLCSAYSRVWHLQDLLLTETDQALERAITGLLKPALRTHFEQMLEGRVLTRATSSALTTGASTERSLVHLNSIYRNNLPLLRTTLLDRLSSDLKTIPFAELVRLGQLPPTYTKTIHALIRHADEELSQTLFAFHEELHRLPDTIQRRVSAVGTAAATQAARLCTTALLLL